MANQQLVDYIQGQLQRGVTEIQIREILAANNWQARDVDEAFVSINMGASIKPAQGYRKRNRLLSVWLGFMIISYSLIIVLIFLAKLVSPLLNLLTVLATLGTSSFDFGAYAIILQYSIIASVFGILCVVFLFRWQKWPFWFICFMAAAGLIFSLIFSPNHSWLSISAVIISSILSTLLLYLILKPQWQYFENNIPKPKDAAIFAIIGVLVSGGLILLFNNIGFSGGSALCPADSYKIVERNNEFTDENIGTAQAADHEYCGVYKSSYPYVYEHADYERVDQLDQFKFQIYPPAGWIVKDSRSVLNSAASTISDDSGSAGLEIETNHPSPRGLDLDGYIKDDYVRLMEMVGETLDSKYITISGERAYWRAFRNDGSGAYGKGEQLFVIHNQYAYIVTAGVAAEEDWDKYKDVLEKSLLSFEILK